MKGNMHICTYVPVCIYAVCVYIYVLFLLLIILFLYEIIGLAFNYTCHNRQYTNELYFLNEKRCQELYKERVLNKTKRTKWQYSVAVNRKPTKKLFNILNFYFFA